jgi:MYXO-CTERM domain-containing protein
MHARGPRVGPTTAAASTLSLGRMDGLLLGSSLSRSTRLRTVVVSGLASLGFLLGGSASAAIVPGQVILRTGDAPTGGPLVTSVQTPFVNDGGQVAFGGYLADGDHFVFVEDSVVWLGSDAMGSVLAGPEATMDTDGAGNWVYAPSVDGIDGLLSSSGLLAVGGGQAEGFPPGVVYINHSRPSMTADGAIYWIAGIDIDGNGEIDIQAFYRSPDAMPGNFELLLASGDMVGAAVIDDANAGSDGGIDGDYSLSEDGAHRIHVLNLDGDSASDNVVWVDGAVVMREGDPTGGGDGWSNFDLVAINASGDYLVTGNTDSSEESDEYIAYNGTLAIREGDMVGGVTLQTSATLRFASLNDQGQAAFGWGYQMAGSFRESIFFSCNAADLANSSVPIITTSADSIDVDDDGVGDFTVTDVLASTDTGARGLGETLFVYAQVELDDGDADFEAIVEIPVICCGNGVTDPAEDCDDANDDDTDDCLASCVLASCGDGIIHAGFEDCDDANDDDTDDCPTTCAAASCGDGFVQDGVEECDDANDDDTDGCRSDCTLDTGGSSDTLDTGVDDTAGTSASGSGGDVEPDTGMLDAGTLDAGTETDTDTDTAAGDDSGGGGCGCRTDTPPLTGMLWSLLGLGLLGLGRRRPRSE